MSVLRLASTSNLYNKGYSRRHGKPPFTKSFAMCGYV
jgi:hypothetical protein